MRKAIEARRLGFTLIELLVVIAIIGILVSLILVASADGVRRAEERATQALITKLETAVNDRLDALLNTQPPINQTHRLLGAINVQQPYGNGTAYLPLTDNSSDRRAQVIAQFDFIRAEMPDVFFVVNALTSDGGSIASYYPLNFAGSPYPAGSNTLSSPITQYTTGTSLDGGSWVLPLGNYSGGLPMTPPDPTKPQAVQLFPTATNPPLPNANYRPLPVTGMCGASFSAAGGIYKNLGYTPTGYDGIDNDGNGLIDDMGEGVPPGMTLAQFQAQVNGALARHTHKTARSEMLYALLVEGLSPLGSAFNREDFTAREVQDTDGDGLPEFVDAWGEPLQFFRWPLYYGGPLANGQILGTSDSQKGYNNYAGPSEVRQQDQLDTNQLLVSPGWWTKAANASSTLSSVAFSPPGGNDTSSYPASFGAIGFMNYFHSLVDPAPGGTGWDRSGSFARREYFTKILILSAGPDKEPGVAQFAKDYTPLLELPASDSKSYIYTFPDPNKTIEGNALSLIYVENQASVTDPLARSGAYYEKPDTLQVSGATPVTIFLTGSANSDDITNHNISGISTGVR